MLSFWLGAACGLFVGTLIGVAITFVGTLIGVAITCMFVASSLKMPAMPGTAPVRATKKGVIS